MKNISERFHLFAKYYQFLNLEDFSVNFKWVVGTTKAFSRYNFKTFN